jgi:tetratricopeptide (TPR) repeat protein
MTAEAREPFSMRIVTGIAFGALVAVRICSAGVVPGAPGRHASGPSDRAAQAPLATRIHDLREAANRAKDSRHVELELAIIREIILLSSDDLLAHCRLGEISRSLGDREGAVAYYERATEIAPADPAMATNLGTVLLEADRIKEAHRWLTRWVDRIPDCGELGLLLGKVCVRRNRPREALIHLRAALNARKHVSPELVFDVASIQRDLGEYREAEAAFRRCSEMDPDSLSARLSVVSLMRAGERFDEAEKAIAALPARHVDHPDVRWERAMLHHARGRLEQAVADFDTIDAQSQVALGRGGRVDVPAVVQADPERDRDALPGGRRAPV